MSSKVAFASNSASGYSNLCSDERLPRNFCSQPSTPDSISCWVCEFKLYSKFVRRERDHEDIIGYDDVNQLFWYREAIVHIVLNDKVSMQLIQKSSTLSILS